MKPFLPLRPRRVAIISEHASPLAPIGHIDSGGQNIYVAHVARNLAALGWNVDVFTRRDAEDQKEICEWSGGEAIGACGSAPATTKLKNPPTRSSIRVIHVPAGPASFVRKEELAPLMPQFAGWMLSFTSRENLRYDVMHPNFWTSGMVALTINKALGIPFVMTFHALGPIRRMHQGDADQFPDQRDRIEAEIARRADAVIAECPQDRADLAQLYDVPHEKMPIIPCGFDPAEIWPIPKAHARAALGFDEDEKIVLQLGRIVPRKGIDIVIRGLAKLRYEHGVRARLVVVGGAMTGAGSDAPEMERLLHVASEAGVTGQVTLVGRRDREDLKWFYSAADVFVTVPWYEPFGITPLEAMACGTPVVGADVGGIRYSVQHERTGLIVPPRDPDAVASALARLFRDPDYMRQLGLEGIRRVNEQFTWRQVTQRIAALYEKVIAQRNAAVFTPAAPLRQRQPVRQLSASFTH